MKYQMETAMKDAEIFAKSVLADTSSLTTEAIAPPFPNTIAAKIIKLKIYYLFPQLNDWQQSMLACLFWQHSLLEKLVNTHSQESNAQFKTRYELIVATIEQKYMDLVQHVKKIVPFHQLTPLQRMVIEERFISISFQTCSD